MSNLPEIIFSSSDPNQSRQITILEKEGQIKKLIPRVYTSNLDESPDSIVARHWMRMIATLFPGAILSHRSAIEFKPSIQKNLYLTYNTRKVIKWPGLTLRMTIGPKPLEDDNQVYSDLYASSLERACLENLTRSREVDGEKRTLDKEKVERRLIQELQTRGESGINKLRDRAREIADAIDMKDEFNKLDTIISAILSTQPDKILRSKEGKAMAIGEPYDTFRLELFSILLTALHQSSLEIREDDHNDPVSFRNMAFIESYFSNYIEGTKFVVEEAESIIYEGKIIPNRTGDTHDILGTFSVCGDKEEMSQLPANEKELLELLRSRHSTILEGRPDKNPGMFKTKSNRAGDTVFVEPELVVGTLKEGFRMMYGLQDPLARAMFVMFLISEVHPFDDGNGRIARIMMNAELVAGNRCKIIIPTVFREDYLLNLRRLTRQKDPKGYIRMMDRAHSFSSWLKPIDLQGMKLQLYQSNALRESNEASLQFPVNSRSSITS